MNWAGFGLVMIVVGLVIAMIFLNNKIKFVTNTYWFWLAIAAISFFWVFGVRFVSDWSRYWSDHTTSYADPGYFWNSKTISRAFMLDACPMFFSLTCISLMADPSRRLARIFAPIALVGGVLTLSGLPEINTAVPDINAQMTAEFIFFGLNREKGYFIMHTLQILLATGVLLNTPKSNWRTWIESLGSFIIFLGYVGIVIGATGTRWFASGLVPNDYITVAEAQAMGTPEFVGEYHAVHDIFTMLPREAMFPFLMVMLLFLGSMFGIVLKNFVFCRWIWKYGDVKSKIWWQYWDYNKFRKKPNKSWW